MEPGTENHYGQQSMTGGYVNGFSPSTESKPAPQRPKHVHALVGIVAIIILLLGAYQLIVFSLSFPSITILGSTSVVLLLLTFVTGILLVVEGIGMLNFKRWAVDLFIGQSIIGILILLYDLLFKNNFTFSWQVLISFVFLVYFIFVRKYFSVSLKYSAKFIYIIIAVILAFVLGLSVAGRAVVVKKLIPNFGEGISTKSVDRNTYYDILTIKSWLMFYYNDQGYYPPGQGIILGGDAARCLDVTGFKPVCGDTKYTKSISESADKSRPYKYFQMDGGKDYKILFEFVEGGFLELAAGAHIATPKGIDPEVKQAGGSPQEQNSPLDNISNQDSDGDGLSDSDEINIWKTDPANLDTDNDGYLDGDEVKNGYDPKGAGKLNQ